LAAFGRGTSAAVWERVPPTPREVLLAAGWLPAEQVVRFVAEAAVRRVPIPEVLVLAGMDEPRWCAWLSGRLAVPRAGVGELLGASRAALSAVPAELACERRSVPFRIDRDGYLWLAMADPADELAIAELEFFSGRNLIRHVAAPSAIAAALYRFYRVRTPLCPEPANDEVERSGELAPSVLRSPPAPECRAERWVAGLARDVTAARETREVVRALIAHMAARCGHAAFLVVRDHALVSHRDRLSLAEASALQGLAAVPSRFRGALRCPRSSAFVRGALGASPCRVALVSIPVRGRVVGILCGADEQRVISDAALVAIACAASDALQRVA